MERSNEVVSGSDEQLGDSSQKFEFLSHEDLHLLPPLTWLVPDVVPEDSLVLMHGSTGTYKSFLALDLALSVASGEAWHGREVRKGTVIYVAGEGARGYPRRVASWKEARDKSDMDFYLVPRPVQLLDDEEVRTFLSELSRVSQNPSLVVLDTLSRCFVGGEENGSRQMSLAINAADLIRTHTGATVLLVHHTGKGGAANGPRGHSNLPGACEVVLLTETKKNSSILKVECTKSKDDETVFSKYFDMVKYGDSLVLTPREDAVEKEKVPVRARECLHTLSKELRGRSKYTVWEKATGFSKNAFSKSRSSLLEAGYVQHDELTKLYTVTPAGYAVIGEIEGAPHSPSVNNEDQVPVDAVTDAPAVQRARLLEIVDSIG